MITEFDLGRLTGRDALHAEPWYEAVVRRAREGGITELSDGHWRVIEYLRDHFVQYWGLPPEQDTCLNSRLEAQCIGRLFRNIEEAVRVAGLPLPGDNTGLEFPVT